MIIRSYTNIDFETLFNTIKSVYNGKQNFYLWFDLFYKWFKEDSDYFI